MSRRSVVRGVAVVFVAGCLAPMDVVPAPVATVQLIGPDILAMWDSGHFRAVPLAADGGPTTGGAIVWHSDSTALASVDASGLVTARALGTATLSATIGGVTGQATLRVIRPSVCLDDGATTDSGCSITDTSGYQLHPAISGSRVVWEDYRYGASAVAIFMLDLATQQLTQITPPNTDNHLPKIDGDKIVYARLPPTGDWELYYYDMATHTETLFSTIPRYLGLGQFSVSGHRVAWHTRRNGNWDVFVYDFASGMETRLTTDSADQADPSIFGDTIVWADRRNSAGWWDVYMYDFRSGREQRITQASTMGRSPVVAADRIVWGDIRGAYFALFEFNFRATPHERPVTTTPVENFLAIAGPYVAWVNRDDSHYPDVLNDVFLYDFATRSELRLTQLPALQWWPALSTQYVVWEDWRTGKGHIYVDGLAALFRH